MMELDFFNRANAEYVERLYLQYLADPHSVDPQWAFFFAGFEAARGNGTHGPAAVTAALDTERSIGVSDLIHSYRELGHLIANLDPLGHDVTSHPLLEPAEFGFGDADLDRVVECASFKGCTRTTVRDLVARLHATYSGTL